MPLIVCQVSKLVDAKEAEEVPNLELTNHGGHLPDWPALWGSGSWLIQNTEILMLRDTERYRERELAEAAKVTKVTAAEAGFPPRKHRKPEQDRSFPSYEVNVWLKEVNVQRLPVGLELELQVTGPRRFVRILRATLRVSPISPSCKNSTCRKEYSEYRAWQACWTAWSRCVWMYGIDLLKQSALWVVQQFDIQCVDLHW